jgi:hypothetical protein
MLSLPLVTPRWLGCPGFTMTATGLAARQNTTGRSISETVNVNGTPVVLDFPDATDVQELPEAMSAFQLQMSSKYQGDALGHPHEIRKCCPRHIIPVASDQSGRRGSVQRKWRSPVFDFARGRIPRCVRPGTGSTSTSTGSPFRFLQARCRILTQPAEGNGSGQLRWKLGVRG